MNIVVGHYDSIIEPSSKHDNLIIEYKDHILFPGPNLIAAIHDHNPLCIRAHGYICQFLDHYQR
jgi:hypothetical protein